MREKIKPSYEAARSHLTISGYYLLRSQGHHELWVRRYPGGLDAANVQPLAMGEGAVIVYKDSPPPIWANLARTITEGPALAGPFAVCRGRSPVTKL